VYLGVDGGGTKTGLALVDRAGNIVARQQAGPACYVATNLTAIRTMLGEAVTALLTQAKVAAHDLEFAFFGLPGYGEDSGLTPTLDALPAPFLPAGHYRCGNDMVCGWAGSLGGADGISVVAGTGSISYGERHGNSARSGGWGELFGDEGSAYWIARRGLELYSRMSDGRMPRSPLYNVFKSQLRLEYDLDLCALVYGQMGGARAPIAQYAKLVYEAAQGGDLQAIGIYTQAAEELAHLADATRVQLAFALDEAVPVSYSGGVFTHAGALLQPSFAAALAARCTRFELREPCLPPDIGAALYAARSRNTPLAATALARLRVQACHA
jgi:N-acetylglucosamine kinase-like BadF-type ATPase